MASSRIGRLSLQLSLSLSLSLQTLEFSLSTETKNFSLSLEFSRMEMERVTELTMDRRPRKRPRLGWDVLPQAPQVNSTRSVNFLFFLVFCSFFCRSDGKLWFLWDQVWIKFLSLRRGYGM